MRCRSATRTSSDRSRVGIPRQGQSVPTPQAKPVGFLLQPIRSGRVAAAEGDGQRCVLPLEHPSTVPSASMHKSPRFTAGLMRWSARSPRSGTLSGDCSFGRPLMSTVTLIGIDLGKHSFHLHGQDAAGRMMFRKKCSRQDLSATGQHTAQHSGDGGLRRRALDGAPHRRTGPPGQAHFPSSCAPSYRATRMTSPMPRRSARRPRARACGS